MKRWRITPTDATDPTDPSGHLVQSSVVSEVLEGVGTLHLAASFLGAMQRVLPATFCTVFAVGAHGRLETVSAASSYGHAAERTSERYVDQRFDRLDPHMRWLAARARPLSAQLWMGHHRGDELADASYRAACYGDVGIRERLSVLQLLPTGQRAAVNFYRSLAQPEFDATDFARVEAHAPLLAGAAAAHGRSAVVKRASAPALPTVRLLTLSLREREVVDHLLAGRTAKEAARLIGIETTTVRTHQYRAFRRLGIRTMKELLRGAAN